MPPPATALWLPHARQVVACRAARAPDARVALAAGVWGGERDGGEHGGGHGGDCRAWTRELARAGRPPARALWAGATLAGDEGAAPRASLVVESEDGSLEAFAVDARGNVSGLGTVDIRADEAALVQSVMLCDAETLVVTFACGPAQGASPRTRIFDLATGAGHDCEREDDILAECECQSCPSARAPAWAWVLRSCNVFVSAQSLGEEDPKQLWQASAAHFALGRRAIAACACECALEAPVRLVCLLSESGRAEIMSTQTSGLVVRSSVDACLVGAFDGVCPQLALLRRDTEAHSETITFEVLAPSGDLDAEANFTWTPHGLQRRSLPEPEAARGPATGARTMVLDSLRARIEQAAHDLAGTASFLQQKSNLVESLEREIEGTDGSIDDDSGSDAFSVSDLEPLFPDRPDNDFDPSPDRNAEATRTMTSGALPSEAARIVRVCCFRRSLRIDVRVPADSEYRVGALLNLPGPTRSRCYVGSSAAASAATQQNGSALPGENCLLLVVDTSEVVTLCESLEARICCWKVGSPSSYRLIGTRKAPFHVLDSRAWYTELHEHPVLFDYWKVTVAVTGKPSGAARELAEILRAGSQGSLSVRVRESACGLELSAAHPADLAQALGDLRAGLDRRAELLLVPGDGPAWLHAAARFCEAAQEEVSTVLNDEASSAASVVAKRLRTDRAALRLANAVDLYDLNGAGEGRTASPAQTLERD